MGEEGTGGKIRVLIAKPGLDGHDRGAKVVARALRDAGMEVIYSGLRQTPEAIAETAIQEDVDVVGLSALSGAHMTLFPKVVALLAEKGAGDIVVIGGGTIPEQDIPKLKAEGVAEVFGPGTSTKEIVRIVREHAGRGEAGETDEAGEAGETDEAGEAGEAEEAGPGDDGASAGEEE